MLKSQEKPYNLYNILKQQQSQIDKLFLINILTVIPT